ncbi:NUMOD4 domain-containing protein [Foetidibacter luteolus]|uniref:NUMOD4 domain-containing protein n=1 Tax=Foetidibacter luteolus TaxID=2608880 RepID=UPI001A992E1E|nr:NUMOD4 domain-containing protein [Foetidibacter luteolus]
MPKLQYPYQNSSLKNIKGEKWADIPGLEGYYRVSNFGRIRRLEYQMQYKNGAIYVKEERIIKPGVVQHPNQFKGDLSPFLTNRVVIDGKRYNFTLARLVYHCFVNPFDLSDPTVAILCKDGDNFNIRPSNLQMASRKEKQQRVIQRDRFRSPLLDLTREAKKRRLQAIIKKKSKPVTQYAKDGRKLKTFPSMAAAERSTGVFATSIGNQAAGNCKTAGGFTWRWE